MDIAFLNPSAKFASLLANTKALALEVEGGKKERNFRRVEVEPAKLGTFSSSYSIPLRYGGKVEREGRIPTERRMKIRFKLHDDKSEHNL